MCSVFGPGESTSELVIPGQSDATMVLIAFPDVNNVHLGRGVGFERIEVHNYTDERDLDAVQRHHHYDGRRGGPYLDKARKRRARLIQMALLTA